MSCKEHRLTQQQVNAHVKLQVQLLLFRSLEGDSSGNGVEKVNSEESFLMTHYPPREDRHGLKLIPSFIVCLEDGRVGFLSLL